MADKDLSAKPLSIYALYKQAQGERKKELRLLMTKFSPQELPFQEIPVFRICKSGTVDRDAFLTTYEETRQGLRPRPRKDNRWSEDVLNPSTYSTSCNLTYESAERVLDVLTRHHPPAVIAKGTASSALGPVQKTVDRTHNPKDENHVDWWLDGCINDPSASFDVVS